MTRPFHLQKLLWYYIIATFVPYITTACHQTGHSSEKITIAVDIAPQQWILSQIVGDKMEIITIIPQGANPETFEPTASNLRQLKYALRYFTLDVTSLNIADNIKHLADKENLTIVNVADGIEFIRDSICHEHGHRRHVHADHDPHIWTSARNAKTLARNMFTEIIQIDSINTDFYTANYQQLTRRLDTLDAQLSAILSDHTGETFLTWHPSLSYFARDYGLKQLSLGDEGKEPTISQLKKLIDSAATSDAHVFILQKEYDRNQSDALIKSLDPNIRIAEFSPLSGDLEQSLLNIAHTIAGD